MPDRASQKRRRRKQVSKTCTRCKAVKPRADFSKDARRKDGLSIYCRRCVSEKMKAWWGGPCQTCGEHCWGSRCRKCYMAIAAQHEQERIAYEPIKRANRAIRDTVRALNQIDDLTQ